jgi:hypothetical protein
MSWLTVYTPSYVRSQLGITDGSQDIFLSSFISNVFVGLEHQLGYSLNNMGQSVTNKVTRDRFLDGRGFLLGNVYQSISNIQIANILAVPTWQTLIADQDFQYTYLGGQKETIKEIVKITGLFYQNTQIRLTGVTGLNTAKGLDAIIPTNGGVNFNLNSQITIIGDGTGATAKVGSVDPTTGAITSIIITNHGINYTTATVSATIGTGAVLTANLTNTIPFDIESFVFELVRFAYNRQKMNGVFVESERSGNLSVSYGGIQNNPLMSLQLFAPHLIPEFKQILGWYALPKYPY